MNRLEKILRVTEIVTGVMYSFGAIAICCLFVLMFCDVSGRFIFNSPIKGTTEVCEYLLVAIAFLSLGYAQLKGMHISVETVAVFFPERLRIALKIILHLAAMGFFVIMTSQMAERAYLDYVSKILLSRSTVHLPGWWPSFIAALGCALLVISLGVQVIRYTVTLVSPDQGTAKSESRG